MGIIKAARSPRLGVAGEVQTRRRVRPPLAPGLFRRSALLILLGSALSVLGPNVPAEAEGRTRQTTPTVYAKAKPTTTYIGQYSTIYGSVSGRSKYAKLWLQKYYDGQWHTISRGKLTSSRKYSFKAKNTASKNSFRAVVKATKTIKSRASKTVRTVGKARPVPAPNPTEAPTEVPTEGPSDAPTPEPTPTATPTPPANPLAAARATILKKMNEARRANGNKPPLNEYGALDTVAQNWTKHMADKDDFRHNPNFSDQYPDDCWTYSEIIAKGYTPETVVNGWMGSQGHRDAILSDQTDVGLGYVKTSNGTTYFTGNFCVRSAE